MSESVHYQLGLTKISENLFEEAIELFTLAIEEDSTNPFYFNQRAVCYLNLNQFELSMFDMNMSIQLDENYAYFYSCRGFLKAKLKDLEGAIADYEQSLELDPENQITYNNMGLVLEQMGNMSQAQNMYQKSNDILGYDPEKRVLNEEGTHMVDKEESSIVEPTEEAPVNGKKERRKGQQKLAKEVFSKRSTFKEFLRFIGNGFKLKKDDKSGKS